jgi:Putative auto-transporter adhesin, head GIN domain
MVHKLAVIAVIGLTASAVCMGAAAAIGGKGFGDGLGDFSLFDGKRRCEAVASATAASRDLDWDGSDHAGLAIHATANYAPGNGDKVHATGDPQILAHLRVRDGTVEMDCHGWRNREADVNITLPGRAFGKFILTGTGKMNLDRLNQASLKVQIAGVATIKANGQVDDLRIEMAGVSKADFGQVTGRRADVKMAGVSKADIAPSDEANIEIAGPSEVTLHSSPKKLETNIAGPGQIHKVAAGD